MCLSFYLSSSSSNKKNLRRQLSNQNRGKTIDACIWQISSKKGSLGKYADNFGFSKYESLKPSFLFVEIERMLAMAKPK